MTDTIKGEGKIGITWQSAQAQGVLTRYLSGVIIIWGAVSKNIKEGK
jgi:hypothetical protein